MLLLVLLYGGFSATSEPYLKQRTELAANIASRYNKSMRLLAGAHAGGNGFQWNGYSIIDENYFAAKALEPYNPSLAAILNGSVTKWLAHPAAAGWRNDRRENLFGIKTCVPTTSAGTLRKGTGGDSESCMVYGSYTVALDGANVANSPYVVYQELNNPTTFTPTKCYAATGTNINHCVPLLLALHLGGNDVAARRIYKQLLSYWDGKGFGPVDQQNQYQARSLCYFIFAQHALGGKKGYETPATTMAAIEKQLWALQVCDHGPSQAIPSTYYKNGTARCPPREGMPGKPTPGLQLTSIETAGIALLAYDSRIKTEWFPPPTTQRVERQDGGQQPSPPTSTQPASLPASTLLPATMECAQCTFAAGGSYMLI